MGYPVISICRTISIHALRGESDASAEPVGGLTFNFNPRSPWGERPIKDAKADRAAVFQSTPSARRATAAMLAKTQAFTISIHALREESDR